MPTPSLIGNGTAVGSASTVATPTTLVPGLPTTRSNGDWLFAVTSCTSASATVSEGTDWDPLYDVTGTVGHLACFQRKVDGSEAAASITWAGLTTGAAGTPCHAKTSNLGQGFLEDASSLLIIDVLGAVSNQSASSTINAGGATLTTVLNDTFVIAHGVRLNAALSAIADAGGSPVSWANIQGDLDLSGADMAHFASVGVGPSPAGAITAHTWTITGGSSITSTGVMVALALAVDVAPVVQYTRGG